MKRNYLIALGAGVIIVIALIATSILGSGSSNPKFDNLLVSAQINYALFSQTNAASYAIGIGGAGNFPKKLNAPALNLAGKPEILYIGSNYCPYCAAQRWPMIIALSRFGTFSNLHYMTSSASDIAPSTATFTFYNSSYQSQYITFIAREMQKNKLVNGTYPTLQTLNATENGIINTLDNGGGIPFIDFANKTYISGASYSPMILQQMNWTQIAAQLNNPNSTVGQSIIGSANLITAQICRTTNNTPSSVCMQSAIQKILTFT